jgi:hypothetical protein
VSAVEPAGPLEDVAEAVGEWMAENQRIGTASDPATNEAFRAILDDDDADHG